MKQNKTKPNSRALNKKGDFFNWLPLLIVLVIALMILYGFIRLKYGGG